MAVSEGKLLTSADVVTQTGANTVSGDKDFTGQISVIDANFTVKDNADNTKQAKLQLSGIATGTTRTVTLPDANITVAGLEVAQTFTSKQTLLGANNDLGISTSTGTTNLATGATSSGNTKTVNIGTAGASGSTTTIAIGSATAGANGSIAMNHATTFASTARLAGFAVAGLPAAGTAGARAMAFVTDATVAHAGNSGNIVAGGGANFVPVYSDGTNWRIL